MSRSPSSRATRPNATRVSSSRCCHPARSSTEQTDRREKLVAYLNAPSLRHYLLVAQDEVRIDHYYRNADGTWGLAIRGPGDDLVLTCPSATLSVDAKRQTPKPSP